MGEGVSPDKYRTIRTGANRLVACWSGAHSCGDADHNCTFVRFYAWAREDVQGVGTHIRILGRRKRRATQQSPCTPTHHAT